MKMIRLLVIKKIQKVRILSFYCMIVELEGKKDRGPRLDPLFPCTSVFTYLKATLFSDNEIKTAFLKVGKHKAILAMSLNYSL